MNRSAAITFAAPPYWPSVSLYRVAPPRCAECERGCQRDQKRQLPSPVRTHEAREKDSGKSDRQAHRTASRHADQGQSLAAGDQQAIVRRTD